MSHICNHFKDTLWGNIFKASQAIKQADLIITLKAPRPKLIYRNLRRRISHRKKDKNRPVLELLKLLYWSQKYKFHNEVKHLDLAKKFKKKTLFLKNNGEIENFLKSLAK